MYSTCLYCTGNLGSNDVLETLPIGRRVAFDAAQGRLWVVCRRCEKWNLVPFDTRLETIDACERYFSEARLRFSTDNIGIARVQEGMELVRIGPAERPEFAAWRYGDQFGRRRKRMAVQFVAASAVAGALVVSRHLLLPIASGGFGLQVVNWAHILYRRRRAVVRVPERDGVGGVMTVSQAQQAAIVTHGRGDWSLRVKMYDRGRAGFATGLLSREIDLSGDHAVEALGHVLPRVNSHGASRTTVKDAVDLVDGYGDVDGIIEAHRKGGYSSSVPDPLKDLDARVRFALEMAAHEDTERTALAGELKLLEREWRAADELAKIADSLAVSAEGHGA